MKFENFDQFWIYYLQQHQNKTCRALHYLGSFTGPICAYLIWINELPWVLYLFCMTPAYILSWIGHFIFEKNIPESFSHPLWSLQAGIKMFIFFFTGKITKELLKITKA